MKLSRFSTYFYSCILMCASVFVTSSCGGDDDDPTDPPVQETVKLRQSSVAEGTEVIAGDVTSITLSYNTTVMVSPDANITLNGEKVKAANSPKTTMDVVVNVALEEGKEYTLNIPSGAIVSRSEQSAVAPAFTLHFKTWKAPDPVDNTDAMKVTQMIGFGWNLGNHFDSYDSGNAENNYKITWSNDCPYWDGMNPTKALYTSLAKAGVKTVRIPVTWGPYQDMKDGKYTIDSKYMASVKENVLWAKDAGLNVVLNTHHDEYWQDAYGASNSSATNESIKKRITATWKQIAEAFKEEGDYLIFEVFNELNNNWKTPTAGELRIQNEWNQTGVDAIRAVGGNNATRWIAVPSCQASPTYALKDDFKLPTDNANKIIVAVHCYDPYGFTLADPFQTETWGHKSGGANDEKNITDLFAKLKTKFLDQNIPVYLGEFGCSRHSSDKANKCREYYLEYFCRAAYSAGLACCIWDNQNPGTGPEHHSYFSHKDGSWQDNSEALVKKLIKAVTSNDPQYTLESIYKTAP